MCRGGQVKLLLAELVQVLLLVLKLKPESRSDAGLTDSHYEGMCSLHMPINLISIVQAACLLLLLARGKCTHTCIGAQCIHFVTFIAHKHGVCSPHAIQVVPNRQAMLVPPVMGAPPYGRLEEGSPCGGVHRVLSRCPHCCQLGLHLLPPLIQPAAMHVQYMQFASD